MTFSLPSVPFLSWREFQGMGLGASLRIVVEPEGEPGDDGEHAEPAELAGEVTDFLVVEKNAPLFEQDGPVAFVGIDERKDEGACVRHVCADVQEIFEEPEERESQAVGLALDEEEGRTQKRHEKFREGAAENHQCMAAETEERVAGFMNREVGVIQEQEVGVVSPSVEKEEQITSKDNRTA